MRFLDQIPVPASFEKQCVQTSVKARVYASARVCARARECLSLDLSLSLCARACVCVCVCSTLEGTLSKRPVKEPSKGALQRNPTEGCTSSPWRDGERP